MKGFWIQGTVLVWLLHGGVSAWVSPPLMRRGALSVVPTTIPRYLHPNQAKELEECAYELIKQGLQEEASSAETTTGGNATQQSPAGPWGWCVKRLSMRLAATNGSAEEEEEEDSNLKP
jgi:hypothetical protein